MEKTLKSPLDCEEVKPINPKGNQPWIFIGRIGAEAEAPIIWSPDEKSWLIGEENMGATEDEMVGWPHWFNGHDFEQALEDSEG